MIKFNKKYIFTILMRPEMDVTLRDVHQSHAWTGGGCFNYCIAIAYFVLTCIFLILISPQNASGSFWLYSVICLVVFSFIYMRLLETKSRSLEGVEKELVK